MLLKEDLEINPQKISKQLEDFIREKMEKLQREGLVIGLSGGLDSSVVASLSVRAVGKDKVLGLIMPEKDSKPESKKNALFLAKHLGIKVRVKPITSILNSFGSYHLSLLRFLPKFLSSQIIRKSYKFYREKTGKSPFLNSLKGLKEKEFRNFLCRGNAYYRIKHRVRMLQLYLVAEMENRLVVGCANKTECLVGYFVKFGCDHASDIMPLLGLYKTQVLRLASYLGIPKKIIDKAPSPDIIPGIDDSFALGMDYEELDLILLGLEKGLTFEEITKELNIPFKDVDYVNKLKVDSFHMRKVFSPQF